MPKKSLWRIIVILVSAAVGFGIFFGVNLFLVNRTVTKPLESSLQQVAGVLSVRAFEGDRRLRIEVELDRVPDFRKTYSSIARRVSEIAGRREYDLYILDHRDEQLETAYHQMHFAIEEAIATGGFSEMADVVERKSRELGLPSSKVFVDQTAVYLQVESPHGYLYAFFPRAPGAAPVQGLVFGGRAGP